MPAVSPTMARQRFPAQRAWRVRPSPLARWPGHGTRQPQTAPGLPGTRHQRPARGRLAAARHLIRAAVPRRRNGKPARDAPAGGGSVSYDSDGPAWARPGHLRPAVRDRRRLSATPSCGSGCPRPMPTTWTVRRPAEARPLRDPSASLYACRGRPGHAGLDRASHRELDEGRSIRTSPSSPTAGAQARRVRSSVTSTLVGVRAGDVRLVIQGKDIYRQPRPLVQALHDDLVNRGPHVIHTGGRFDSHLLIPRAPAEARVTSRPVTPIRARGPEPRCPRPRAGWPRPA